MDKMTPAYRQAGKIIISRSVWTRYKSL